MPRPREEQHRNGPEAKERLDFFFSCKGDRRGRGKFRVHSGHGPDGNQIHDHGENTGQDPCNEKFSDRFVGENTVNNKGHAWRYNNGKDPDEAIQPREKLLS